MIIDDCRLLMLSLPRLASKLVKRSANQTAHFVVRATISMTDFKWACMKFLIMILIILLG